MQTRRQALQLAAFAALTPKAFASADDKKSRWSFIQNDHVKLGVDASRGASIGYFGAVDGANLLNHYDTGRFIQQSYYGNNDDTTWHGRPWSYNPIQGGSPDNTPARVETLTNDGQTLYAKITPRLWSDTPRMAPEAMMEQWLSLQGPVAHIRMKMTYTGPSHSQVKAQEMPAVFVDAEYPNLVYYEGRKPWTGDTLTRRVPGWPNESERKTEEWFAYVNDEDIGIGCYTPGTPQSTSYRFEGDGKTGPSGSACSYAAPVRRFALTKGLVVDYPIYLTVGTVEEIRQRFHRIYQTQ